MNAINGCYTHPPWPFTSILALLAPPRECKLFFLFCAAPIYLFIPLSVLADWTTLHFVLSCNLQLTLFSIIIQNLLKYSLLDSIILYLIYESIKSFISCVCKTGALKSMKSLRKEGQNRSLSTLLNYLTIQLIISVSKKYFHLHICTSWLHLFSSLACGHESEC